MDRAKEAEQIRNEFTRQQRFLYWAKRNIVLLIIAVIGLLIVNSVPEVDPDQEFNLWAALVQLLGKSLLDTAVKLFAVFLVLKFSFPKIAFQHEIINHQNIAAALLFLALILLVM